MSRNNSTPKQEDVTNFLQCSRVDPKEMPSEYKFNRHGDFKKLANDALAPNASPDDLKKLKAGLRESITKGREALRGPTSNGVPGEDRASPIVADENAKMKRKRSVIKADAASSTSLVSSQSNDGYREPKQGIYHRNLPDSRSRRTDTFGSRGLVPFALKGYQ
nr:hypothetical protein [Tanacetum cinerariifolium]